MPKGYETHYKVHPTALDSVIQAAYTPLLASGSRLRTVLVTRRVRKLEITSAISDLDTGHVLGARAVITKQSPQMLSANLRVVDDENHGKRLVVDGRS